MPPIVITIAAGGPAAGTMRFFFQEPAVSRDRRSSFPAYPDGIATMRNESGPHPDALLADVRSGREEALGTLLELYRNYLKLLAGTEISLHLAARANPSDVVQDTFFEACRDFKQFRGTTEAEFLAWLRRILVRNLARLVERHVLTKKRDQRRELSLDQLAASLERSSSRLETALVAPATSPSTQLHNRERSALLADHLARLPDDYREVLVLRHLEELPFDQVGRRMQRSSGAVRMLWLRALDQLRRQLTEEGWL
jgi:RNA polymerase sigma-70 factor, ECF subfamily